MSKKPKQTQIAHSNETPGFAVDLVSRAEVRTWIQSRFSAPMYAPILAAFDAAFPPAET